MKKNFKFSPIFEKTAQKITKIRHVKIPLKRQIYQITHLPVFEKNTTQRVVSSQKQPNPSTHNTPQLNDNLRTTY